ncbi:MAG: hypothetical protein AB1714_30045 [Acidobacteriota bacterium]
MATLFPGRKPLFQPQPRRIGKNQAASFDEDSDVRFVRDEQVAVEVRIVDEWREVSDTREPPSRRRQRAGTRPAGSPEGEAAGLHEAAFRRIYT